MKYGPVFAVLFLVLTLPVQAMEEVRSEIPLRFGVYPSKSPKLLHALYQPLADYLSSTLHRPVELVTAPDRDMFFKRALAGNYDLAVACVACYFRLRDQAGYRAIVHGEPSFHGALVVRRDSTLTSPLQLYGHTVGAIGHHSYAGYLFFHAWLIRQGCGDNPPVTWRFLGNNESVLFAVLNRRLDGGLVQEYLLNAEKFQPYRKHLRVLLRSDQIPHMPFLVHPSMDERLVSELTSALVALRPDDRAARTLFQTLGLRFFRRVDESDFADFRSHYRETTLLVERKCP